MRVTIVTITTAALALAFAGSATAQSPTDEPAPAPTAAPPPPPPPHAETGPPPPPDRSAEETDPVGPRKLMLMLGPGFSLGFFYPQDVNRYMENWQDSQADMVVEESGFTGMILNLVPRLAICFAPIEYVQLQALAEIGWGPKIISVQNADTEVFHFVRYSLGGTLNGHLPLKHGKYSLFLGGGVLYHWMRFEDYAADTLGYRGLVGFRIYLSNKRFTPEVFVAFDYAKAGTGKPINAAPTTNPDGSIGPTVSSGKELELNYTGVMIGANFYFKLTG